MKIAIISDIHGNLEAFLEVLKDIDASRVDAVVSIGDHVGYGPDPEAVISQVRKRKILAVMGNHELGLKDDRYLKWFNPLARESLQKTRVMLSESATDWIFKLPAFLIYSGCRFVHGFPPDSAKIYLFQVSDSSLRRAFERNSERICWVGHTHDLEIISYDGCKITRTPLEKGFTCLENQKRYIINIGSVGQPRDGNNNAKYVIWDTRVDTVDLKFVPYDIAAVVQKIEKAGLPSAHARRLW